MAKNTGPALIKHDTKQSDVLCRHGDLCTRLGGQRRVPHRDREGVHGALRNHSYAKRFVAQCKAGAGLTDICA